MWVVNSLHYDDYAWAVRLSQSLRGMCSNMYEGILFTRGASQGFAQGQIQILSTFDWMIFA